jgi:tight adherence protein C
MNDLICQYGLLAASICWGVAVGAMVFFIGSILRMDRTRFDGSGTFEKHRRDQLRQANFVFRYFEPLVVEISGVLSSRAIRLLPELRRDLVISREPLPWKPDEFLATKILDAILIGIAVFLILRILGFAILAWMFAAALAMTYPWLAVRTVGDRARRRIKRLRIRLPFTIDLISLMMEAGASFPESLETVVRENAEHPLGEEFGEVERQIALGRTRAEALRGLQQRLANDDFSELVFAINKGEELGTPITSVLRDQADQMRVKRSQWGEKAAGEAQVQLVFPGMVVMVACLLVVVAPIILPALLQYL